MLSLPAGTEMFHFPALPPPALCVQAGVTGNYARQVSLFGNPRINVWLPTPRGLSQAPTSFIGSWCQGIHRVPLSTWQLLDARVHCAVLKIRAVPAPQPVARRGSPVLVKDDLRAAVPSGPNSVLGLASPQIPAFLPHEAGVLTGPGSCPDRITSAPLTSYHPGTPVRVVALDAVPARPGAPGAP